MHVFHKFDTEFQLVICVQSAGFKLVVIETKRLTLSNNRSYWNNSMLKKHLAQVANLILSILSDKTITGNTRWMKQTVHWHSLPYVAFVSQTTSALSVAQRAVKSRPIKRIVYEVRRNRAFVWAHECRSVIQKKCGHIVNSENFTRKNWQCTASEVFFWRQVENCHSFWEL